MKKHEILSQRFKFTVFHNVNNALKRLKNKLFLNIINALKCFSIKLIKYSISISINSFFT
jgi:hypothetical protein